MQPLCSAAPTSPEYVNYVKAFEADSVTPKTTQASILVVDNNGAGSAVDGVTYPG